MRDSFVFYRSFFESIEQLNKKDQLETYKAIADFALNDKEADLSGVAKIIYEMAKPNIVANKKRYANGFKGGRPKNDEDDSPKKDIVGVDYFIITEKQYDSACERLGKDVVDKAILLIDSWFARKKDTTAKDYIGRNNYGFMRADNSFVVQAKQEVEKELNKQQPNWSV